MFKGLSNLANLGSLMKQAQEMGAKMKTLQSDLRAKRVTGSAGGGLVQIEVNGVGEVLGCRLDRSCTDLEMLEDLIPMAVSDALTKAKELHAQGMQDISGMDLSSMQGLMSQLGE